MRRRDGPRRRRPCHRRRRDRAAQPAAERATLRGGLALTGARISADLGRRGARIDSADSLAIDGTEVEIGGSVVLRKAAAAGEVRLVASVIGGDLDASGATLTHAGAMALDISRCAVKGAFFLRGEASIAGALSMTGASIGTIHDEVASWHAPVTFCSTAAAYGAFIAAPVDAESRSTGSRDRRQNAGARISGPSPMSSSPLSSARWAMARMRAPSLSSRSGCSDGRDGRGRRTRSGVRR